jgi:hypothetical protein
MRISHLSALVILSIGPSVWAQVTDVQVTSTPFNTAQGYVTNELRLTFDNQLTSVQLLTGQLSAGDIYQDGEGSDTAPSASTVSSFPTVANDTFVQFGAKTSDDPNAVMVNFAGGAVDIGGSVGRTFDTGLLDVLYFTEPSVFVQNETDYFVGQFTFSDTANGTLDLAFSGSFVTTTDDQYSTFSIVNGEIVLPEDLFFLRGDLNLDGVISGLDIQPFVAALSDPEQFRQDNGLTENGFLAIADIKQDGALTGLDIQPFVNLLSGGGATLTAEQSLALQAIPEPGTFGLVAVGLLGLSRRRRAA